MISDRLRARADRLAGHALRNEPFSPQECGDLAQELLCWADIAESMENTRFAPEALNELADYPCPRALDPRVDTKREGAA